MATLPPRRHPLGQGRPFDTLNEAAAAAMDAGWTVTFEGGDLTAEHRRYFLHRLDGRWYWESTWEPLP